MPNYGVLVFGLNNTQNRYYAAALADQLGDRVIGVATKVAFPPDWVQEHSRGHAKMAAYAVRHCDDPAVLDGIARREKRQLVQEALCHNPLLSEAGYATVLQRAQPGHRRALINKRGYALRALEPEPALDDTPLTQERFFAQLQEEPNRSTSTTVQRIAAVKALCADDPTLANRALRAEATNGGKALAASYLYEYYFEPDDPSLLKLVTLSPVEVLKLHGKDAMTSILSDLVEHLDRAIKQRRPFPKDIATMLVTLNSPEYLCYAVNESGHVQRKLFTDAAADVMLTNPQWDKLLQRQSLTDSQFETLAATRRCLDHIVVHLNGRLERLRVLLDNLDLWYNASLDFNDWEPLFACLSAGSDPMLVRILRHADDETVEKYIEGSLNIGHGDSRTALMPSASIVLDLLDSHPEAVGEVRYFARYGDHQDVGESYMRALVENVPGVADAVKLDPRYGPDIYQYLVATGASEDRILEALEDAENLSLLEITTALAKATV